jgi:hypothetical protein
LVRIACDSFWFGTMTMLLVVVRRRDEAPADGLDEAPRRRRDLDVVARADGPIGQQVQAGEEVGQRLLQRQRDGERRRCPSVVSSGATGTPSDSSAMIARQHGDRDADDAARDAERRADVGLRGGVLGDARRP